MRTKYIISCILGTYMLLGLLYLIPATSFVPKLLWHLNPDIDDYRIFENRSVDAGNYQPWPVAANYNAAPIPSAYNALISNLKTTAFLVIKDGAMVHESYYRGYNDSAYSNPFSVTKSIISLLVGCALADSSIHSLSEPVATYIPEYNTPENKQLTIRQVLTMSSGLSWDESYSNPFSITTKAYYGSGLNKLITGLKVTDIPGRQFKYLSGNTQLLAMVLEKATGKSVSQYASEKIWKHIGASRDALWCLDKEGGMEKSYCCFNSTAQDLARIGQLVLNHGAWQGKQLVPAAYIDAATSPAADVLNEWGTAPLSYYGYHWWITSVRGKKVVYARGIKGQYVFVVPSESIVIVRLGEKRCVLRTNNIPADIYVWLNMGLDLAK